MFVSSSSSSWIQSGKILICPFSSISSLPSKRLISYWSAFICCLEKKKFMIMILNMMHFYLINKLLKFELLLTISSVRIMKIEFIILRDKSSTMSSIGHLLILTTDDVVAQIFLATFKGSRPGCWGPLHCKYFAAMHGDFAIFCSCLDVTAQTATADSWWKVLW